MGIESGTQVKEGGWWNCLKDLPHKSKSKVISFAEGIKKIGKDDPRRIIHSLKVGLALTLVSLIYYWRPLYDGFGVAGMWAVLTVVVVFEFTVGATISKGINRGCATLVAGALGFGSQHLANLFGEKGEPVVLGTLVFILAAGSTFSRFFPKIKARYDYGMVIFILTFSLVAVSGYRIEKLFEVAHQRFSTIIIGGATCMIISLFVCPVWAGEDLHKLVASNIEKLANYLEGFDAEYFQRSEDKAKPEKSKLEGYKSVLNSKASEESLANLARWEPGHGRFRFRHPWKQYLKIGALSRNCAYKMEALSGYLSTEIQVSLEFNRKVQESCTKMTSESSIALKALSLSIKTMKEPCEVKPHLENSKTAVKDLEIAVQTASLEDIDVLAIVPLATVASILVEITRTVEEIYEAVSELSNLAHFDKVEPNVSPEKPHLLHRGVINPVADGGNADHIEIITIQGSDTGKEIASCK
ncbi:aluminum-activated malate transporter 8-like [Neltuma alba]|uniref:aluminum-activated malate transporter 8-like n=1 Tax=Neltuma alba TaxID=207710 RepID=UPI0010A4FB4E|nr:aluminum-activated malate transporter 8-like [Prosopis alba]